MVAQMRDKSRAPSSPDPRALRTATRKLSSICGEAMRHAGGRMGAAGAVGDLWGRPRRSRSPRRCAPLSSAGHPLSRTVLRPAPTPARQQRPPRCRPPNSPTARPRRPQPRRLAPAILTRTVGCLPPLIRPPFRTRDAPGTHPGRTRDAPGTHSERTTTAHTPRHLSCTINLGSGRATQHRLRRLRRFVDCAEKGR